MRSEKYSTGIENRVISSVVVTDLLASLSPEEFEVLWYLSGQNTLKEIANLTELSVSQITTLRHALASKAINHLT